MKVIYKFYLSIKDEQKIKMPVGSKIISIGQQSEDVYLWAICDPENGFENRTIYIFGTGHELPPDINLRSFLGTVTTYDGNYVWHIFE